MLAINRIASIRTFQKARFGKFTEAILKCTDYAAVATVAGIGT